MNKHKQNDSCAKKRKRKRSKWTVEPFFSQMSNALRKCRQGFSTSQVSKLTKIPVRTLRRYIQYSKNPHDNLFFIKDDQIHDSVENCFEDNNLMFFWKSKNPHDNPIFIQDDEQNNDSVKNCFQKKPILCWKPKSSVPMFSLPLKNPSKCIEPIKNFILDDSQFCSQINPTDQEIERNYIFDLIKSNRLFSNLK